MVWSQIFMRTSLAAAMAVGLMMLGGVATAKAESRDSCRRNVDKWEDRLERDVHRFGYDSRQARHDRHELGEARESCEHRFGNYWHDRDGDPR